MRLGTLLLVAATALTTSATPVGPSRDGDHVEHERRSLRTPWSRATRLPRSHTLPLRIGLTQRNLDRADDFISGVADPSSPSYGKHWSREKVIETFAPGREAVDEVLGWLEDEGITRDRTAVSEGGNWISVLATRDEVEHLLRTKYHVYEHEDGHSHVACDSYHVPRRVAEHIDIIMPTVHFNQRLGERGVRIPLPDDKIADLKRRSLEARQLRPEPGIRPGESGILTIASNSSVPKKDKKVPNILAELTTCDTMITPACLRALYGMPPGTHSAPNNTLGVVEYTPQAFLQADLDRFFAEFQPELVGEGPVVHLVAGGVVQTERQSFFYNGESSLDLEYAMALVYPQRVTLYQVGDEEQGASFNNFLDAIDGSYCSFQGGGSKDPNVDGQYGKEECGTAPVVNVISTSYAYNEGDLGARYEARQCAEYMKLGLQGISMVFASGDFGVAGNGNTCFDPRTGAYQPGAAGGIFNPSFPSTCPYVTSVGATEVLEGSTVRSGEVACQKVVRSGGGFSNVFGMPGYQRGAVEEYYDRGGGDGYGSERYNDSRVVRGYPDVSANGANYVTAVNGEFTLSYGTSGTPPFPSPSPRTLSAPC